MADGKLRAVVDRTYQLEEITQAHNYSESGKVKEKLILKLIDD